MHEASQDAVPASLQHPSVDPFRKEPRIELDTWLWADVGFAAE